jgi:hypothetical protein
MCYAPSLFPLPSLPSPPPFPLLLYVVFLNVLYRSHQSQKFSKALNLSVKIFIFGIFAASFIGSLVFLHVSSLNYPGGVAFTEFHKLEENSKVSVHLDVHAAMTGVSRFGQLRDDWQ